jgi:hypothetical protein
LEWQEVDGDTRLVKVDTAEAGEPGDQYKIMLETNGKYRVVTWEKVFDDQDGLAVAIKGFVPSSKYFLVGSITRWLSQEMDREDTERGTLFTCEVKLTSVIEDFQIVVNEDMRLALYPEEPGMMDAGPAQGPDELGNEHTWELAGRIGDTFKIVLERSVRSGVMVSKVSWEKTGEGPPVGDDVRDRFYVVGSWDLWQKPLEMSAASERKYVLERRLPEEGSESFLILRGGYSGQTCPTTVDANPYCHHGIRGPSRYASGGYWTVGHHAGDENLRGHMYKIVLHVTGIGKPRKVTWERLSKSLQEET